MPNYMCKHNWVYFYYTTTRLYAIIIYLYIISTIKIQKPRKFRQEIRFIFSFLVQPLPDKGILNHAANHPKRCSVYVKWGVVYKWQFSMFLNIIALKNLHYKPTINWRDYTNILVFRELFYLRLLAYSIHIINATKY